MNRKYLERKPIKNFLNAVVVAVIALALLTPISTVVANDEGTLQVKPVMSISPATQTVNVGNSFTVDVYIDPEDYLLSGADMGLLSFDETVIQADSITFKDFFGTATVYRVPGTIDNVNGEITLTSELTTPFVGVVTANVWITIDFTAVGLGTSPITMVSGGFPDENGNKIEPITIINGEIVSVEWSVTLNFNETGGNTDYVVFGESPDANDGEPPDSYDAPKPPVPMQPYLRAWFDDNLLKPYHELWEDFRSYPDTEKTWDLYVEWESESSTPTSVTISWDMNEINDCVYTNIILMRYNPFPIHDPVEWEFAINMLTENKYTYTPRWFNDQWLKDSFQIIALEPNNGNGGNGGNGNGGNGGNGDGTTSIPPVADASAGEPYTSYVDEEITFNGSLSYDPDGGDITSWYWDFGEGTNGTGEVTIHTYSNPGVYNVTLTVTDDENTVGSTETTAIVSQANRLPITPIVNGTKIGNKTIEYTYTAISTDPDNDTIRYFFNWGDGNNTASNFFASGTIYNTSYNWTDSGVYTVRVYAKDINNGVSGTTEMTVFIDVNIQFIDDVINGYLIDYGKDGTFDVFYNNATGDTTVVERQNDGSYLIDIDGDDDWDYIYDPAAGVTAYQNEEQQKEKQKSTPGFELIIVVCAIAVFLFWNRKRRDVY